MYEAIIGIPVCKGYASFPSKYIGLGIQNSMWYGGRVLMTLHIFQPLN